MQPALSTLVFYAVSTLLVIAAIGVVTLRSIFHSAMALIAALSLVAGLFVLLGADFLGAGQILVYVGGIMVIMLFVIMLSQQPLDRLQRQINKQWVSALMCAAIVGMSLIQGFSAFQAIPIGKAEPLPTSLPIGRLLLGGMVLPFEVVSLVLVAALVGAVLFAQDTKTE